MKIFGTPQSLPEAYGLSMFLLRFGGLFPFHFDAMAHKFHISWKGLSYTMMHLVIYTYVNITSIMESWRDFSQPIVGQSSLAALGNLLLRLMGIVITFVIITPLIFGSVKDVSSINVFVKLIDELVMLGIDVNCIYRRVYRMSGIGLVFFFGLVTFTTWHSIYFYERITQKPPELKFYLVAILSAFYQLMYLFYAFLQLYGVYAISRQLNAYLADLRDRHQEIYDNERCGKYQLMTKNVKLF